MKSKVTTYLLIAAVLAVWGVIAWKVLNPRPGDDAALYPTSGAKSIADAGADTLLLNYRDPFLYGVGDGPVVSDPDPQPLMGPLPTAPKPVASHNVRYLGRIRRRGVDYSLVEINNAQHLMRMGEVTDNYRLTAIFNDSVQMAFEGGRCCFKLVE